MRSDTRSEQNVSLLIAPGARWVWVLQEAISLIGCPLEIAPDNVCALEIAFPWLSRLSLSPCLVSLSLSVSVSVSLP